MMQYPFENIYIYTDGKFVFTIAEKDLPKRTETCQACSGLRSECNDCKNGIATIPESWYNERLETALSTKSLKIENALINSAYIAVLHTTTGFQIPSLWYNYTMGLSKYVGEKPVINHLYKLPKPYYVIEQTVNHLDCGQDGRGCSMHCHSVCEKIDDPKLVAFIKRDVE